ncbi:LLM class flavin-dependent oxidoreductase [Rothia sp. ZJ1223]|nr:LLM class flavin-dependent oxidoreductase [Rothia sp. ZJ1223]
MLQKRTPTQTYIRSTLVPALSILDLATIYPDEAPKDAFARSVQLAQKAENLGYKRIWYAEHHNMNSIASSAPAVLISHIGAHTEKIRLGAGGVMLPNHSPLTIAEQFGTLAELYPERIDLGLGRAPGTDMNTLRALRREPTSAERFPQDVLELAGYLNDNTRIPGVNATPGRGTGVPLYILGSSLFGAQLAAALGLPYAFASHFAPTHLEQAIATYRREFKPSEQLAEPYVIAAVNVLASDTTEDAEDQLRTTTRQRIKLLAAGGQDLSNEQLDAITDSPRGQQILDMMAFRAVGTGAEAKDYLLRFANMVEADELILSSLAANTEQSLRSYEIIAEQLINN